MIPSKHIDVREVTHDRFEVQHVIWRGQGSLVCKAFDREEQAFRVLKIHRVERGDEIRREWRVRSSLPEHPNLISFHGVFGDHAVDGTPLSLLSMDLADRGTLRTEILGVAGQDNAFKTQAISVFRQVCSGVSLIHHAGGLHLDIKSDNILGHGSSWKVADFGLSYHPDMEGTLPISDPSKGTPEYMSPEQFDVAHPAELSVQADIYSLGIVFYEMLHPTGMPPFAGSYRYLREKHANAEVPMPGGLSDDQREWFSICLAKQASDRFPSLETMLRSLDEAFPDVCSHQSNQAIQDKQTRARSILNGIERDMASGDLEELVSLLAEAERLCPDLPEIEPLLIKIQHRAQKYEAAMAMMQEAMECGRLESALSHARVAQAVHPKCLVVAQVIHRLEERFRKVQGWTQSMEQAMWNGDEERAMFFAQKLDDLRSEE